MYTTIFDLETTGLVKAKGSDQIMQPHITEFYGVQVDKDNNIIKDFDTLVKPPIPIPSFLEKQIGITNQMVRSAPTFLEVYQRIINVFFCSHTMVAHNLSFDQEVIVAELRRIGKEHHFPYPPIKFCTVEQSMHIKGHRLTNTELYKIATGKDLTGAHRARIDVMATRASYNYLKTNNKENEIIKFIKELKEKQETSYREMLHIVSCKFNISTESVDTIYKGGVNVEE